MHSPRGGFCEAFVPVHPSGVGIPFHLCFELALVGLCKQRSSVVHMLVVTLSCVWACFWVVPPYPPLFLLYVAGALLPFCVGAVMARLPGFASHGSSLILELAANSGSSWMFEALNLHLAMLLLISGKLHCLVWSFWQPWAFGWLSILGIRFYVKVIQLLLLCVFIYQFPSGWNCTSVFFYHKTDPCCDLPTNICSTMNSNKVMFPQALINSLINY